MENYTSYNFNSHSFRYQSNVSSIFGLIDSVKQKYFFIFKNDLRQIDYMNTVFRDFSVIYERFAISLIGKIVELTAILLYCEEKYWFYSKNVSSKIPQKLFTFFGIFYSKLSSFIEWCFLLKMCFLFDDREWSRGPNMELSARDDHGWSGEAENGYIWLYCNIVLKFIYLTQRAEKLGLQT